jgi:anaerobic magnesium-protoporphyrin IX monomethyl ester cyclase
VSYPLPGTRFHDAVRAQLGAQRNWVDSDDLAMLYRGPFSTGFYRQLHRVVHREFRLRRAAGTTSAVAHVARAAVRPTSRERLGRARDAVLLPVDEHLLRRRARSEATAS